jgi:SdpC family antimicrobial peptide
MKKNLSFFVLLCLLIISLVSTSWTSNSNDKERKRYSGEELFRGIFFNQGAVASQISVLKSSSISAEEFFKGDNKKLQQVNNLRNNIIAAINKKDPVFFKNFETKLKSKNYYVIDETLKESSKTFIDALQAVNGVKTEQDGIAFKQRLEAEVKNFTKGMTYNQFNNKENLKKYMSSYLKMNEALGSNSISTFKSDACVALAAVGVVVVVAVIAVVAVEAAVVTDTWVLVTSGAESITKSRLSREELIQSIVSINS